jgi:hypothetical protein
MSVFVQILGLNRGLKSRIMNPSELLDEIRELRAENAQLRYRETWKAENHCVGKSKLS